MLPAPGVPGKPVAALPPLREQRRPRHTSRGRPGPRFCPRLRPVHRAGPDGQQVPSEPSSSLRVPTRPAPSRPPGLRGGDFAGGPALIPSRSPRRTRHLLRTRPVSVPTARNGAWYTGVDGWTDGRTDRGADLGAFDRQPGLIPGRRAWGVKGESPRVPAVGSGWAPEAGEERSPVCVHVGVGHQRPGCIGGASPFSIGLLLRLSRMTTNIAV